MISDHIAQLLASGGLSYYASKGNKSRWIAAGTYTVSFIFFKNISFERIMGNPVDRLYNG